jgi:HEAT repeat protein
MIRTAKLACGLAGILVLVGCDVPSLAPDETQQVDPGIYYGRPVKDWFLDRKDADLREQADQYLERVGPQDKDLIPALVPLLKDDDPLVRSSAARLLGQIGPDAKDSLEAIDEATADETNRAVLQALVGARKRIMGLKP